MYCDVEPKRKALEQANSDLATAQEKLTKIKAMIKVSITGRIFMLGYYEQFVCSHISCLTMCTIMLCNYNN